MYDFGVMQTRREKLGYEMMAGWHAPSNSRSVTVCPPHLWRTSVSYSRPTREVMDSVVIVGEAGHTGRAKNLPQVWRAHSHPVAQHSGLTMSPTLHC
jgi:hypothetical protein